MIFCVIVITIDSAQLGSYLVISSSRYTLLKFITTKFEILYELTFKWI